MKCSVTRAISGRYCPDQWRVSQRGKINQIYAHALTLELRIFYVVYSMDSTFATRLKTYGIGKTI